MKKLTFNGAIRILTLFAALVCGCVDGRYPLAKPSDWSRVEHWYCDAATVDGEKVDVFYVASTDVVSSRLPDGGPSTFAMLTYCECQVLLAEIDWIRRHVFTGEFNFFAPLYHQVTFESLGNPRGGRNADWDEAAVEVCEAFDHYMAHSNGGRRFILAGFSQGASVLRMILKHMTDEQYSRCIAAYSMGFQVTADDLRSPHIRPAKGADDQGVIISYNSSTGPEGAWSLVSGDAACAINPVNWRTDATDAHFEFDGDMVTVRLDPDRHLLYVDGYEPPRNAFTDYFPPGNLHSADLRLYAPFIRQNAIRRAYGTREETHAVQP